MMTATQSTSTPSLPAALQRQQAITLFLLFVAGIVNFLDRSSLSIANTTVRAEMHLNATEMGWLLSAFSLAYGLAQLGLVGLLDRAGTRSILGGGLLLWSMAQMLTGLVRGLPSFLALRFLLGIGESPFYPAGVRSVRDWFSPAARARATAIMSSSNPLGLALAPPLLTGLMLRWGWRAMFMALGAAGLAVGAAWICLHRDRPGNAVRWGSAPSEIEAGDSLGPDKAVHTESAWRVLLRSRMVWGMMLGWGGINYTVWLYLAWLPGYLESEQHLTVKTSGWIAAVPFLAGAIGMYASGLLSDHLASRGVALVTLHRRNIVTGMVISAAATLLVAHAATATQAIVGLSVSLFFIHFAGTSGWGYVQVVAPHDLVASLGALQNFASFMIASAAPVATGFLLDRTHSFSTALALCSVVTLLGALSYATLAAEDEKPLARSH